ncbi:MAG: benzoate/H(+) symporter BenE family transporter [Rhodobacter sp.]|nr:benzoate/H(+) symporter BenE family transporter [Rhodobacter sp.]MCA3515222.1 benzoate/H(+) symporter BenE family transporter [Rhodobacter sp.]MCA3519496.1 benzoate/H(+) symporter BenE family transporter [Rhodobacter sp.]MCA3524367.1 benzoate/H(+) symporter BenE family transporter [Rhodobacter sp.]MCA3526671.1 benzoate/H(+) symporter BenE family transporter [Rhodobacter sp.]
MTAGGLSAVPAPFGAHPVSMAVLAAAICPGNDAHPDCGKLWKVSLACGGVWALPGLFGPVVIALMSILPHPIATGLVALALTDRPGCASGAAFGKDGFAATVTPTVSAPGVTFPGGGARLRGAAGGNLVPCGGGYAAAARRTIVRLRARSLSFGRVPNKCPPPSRRETL